MTKLPGGRSGGIGNVLLGNFPIVHKFSAAETVMHGKENHAAGRMLGRARSQVKATKNTLCTRGALLDPNALHSSAAKDA